MKSSQPPSQPPLQAATEGEFSASEWLRYTRHIQLANFGVAGQQKLKKATVVIVGAGGLGCPAGLYLAAAGVGKIVIVDGDQVDITNLQRQIGYSVDDVGASKAKALRLRLLQLNPEIQVESIAQHLSPDNAHDIFQQADIVLDCTDNFATRYLINDSCYQLKKPWVMASIGQFNGQCSLMTPEGPCFRCVFPEMPQNVADCNSNGVIGVLPGMLAMYQVNEAIKYLAGLETALKNQLLLIDALSVTQQLFKLQKNADCKLCGHQDPQDLQTEYLFSCASEQPDPLEISTLEFNQQRQDPKVEVIDVRSDRERQGFHIGGQHIAMENIEQQLQQFTPNTHYIFYCQSGVRSLKVAKQAQQAGLSQVHSLQGGLLAWLKQAAEK